MCEALETKAPLSTELCITKQRIQKLQLLALENLNVQFLRSACKCLLSCSYTSEVLSALWFES